MRPWGRRRPRRSDGARQASSRAASARSDKGENLGGQAAPHWSRRLRRSRACRPERRPASARSSRGCPGPRAPWLSTGTPSTGRRVIDAVMPGRWAAPPAPAMMTLRPLPFAPLGVAVEPLRRAMRRDDLGLVGDAELVEHVGRVLHRRPVRLAAHNDADEGLGRDHDCFECPGKLAGLEGWADDGKGKGVAVDRAPTPGPRVSDLPSTDGQRPLRGDMRTR